MTAAGLGKTEHQFRIAGLVLPGGARGILLVSKSHKEST